MDQMFSEDIISRSIVYSMNEVRSGVFLNKGSTFEFIPFPVEAQETYQFASKAIDLNADGFLDLILGGNCFGIKPEYGMCASSYGTVLLNNKNGTFTNVPNDVSSLFEMGEIRDIETIKIGQEQYVVFGKNNTDASFYKLLKTPN